MARNQQAGVQYGNQNQQQPQAGSQQGSGNKPVDTVKVGSVRIAVWEQLNQQDGSTYYNFTMERAYPTDDNGEEFDYTSSMRQRDLSDAALAWQVVAQRYGVTSPQQAQQ